jgi:hypothetical protein
MKNKIQWSKSWTGDKDTWPTLCSTPVQLEEYIDWCKKNVDANEWNCYGYYRKLPCEFRFKRSEDLLAFKLTFGFT